MLSGLLDALKILAQQLKNPFLAAMLGLTIVLAIAAITEIGIEAFRILAAVVVILFLGYLFHLQRESRSFKDADIRELALRMVIAIKNEDYLPGKETQRDFGAALIGRVREAEGPMAKKAAEVIVREFKKNLDVPESYL